MKLINSKVEFKVTRFLSGGTTSVALDVRNPYNKEYHQFSMKTFPAVESGLPNGSLNEIIDFIDVYIYCLLKGNMRFR